MKKILFFAFPFFAFYLISCEPVPVGGKLENTNWMLASIKQGNKITALPEGTKVSALFGSGKVSGNSTCNIYSGKFEVNGANLYVTDVISTERFCDAMDLENSFLGLLTNAESYSVLKNKLEIFAEDGMLTFMPVTEEEAKAIIHNDGLNELTGKFPVLEGDLMPHLYPILKVDSPKNYPYLGTLVDTSFYKYFDEETGNIWSNTGGEVYAVGMIGDLFVARVPGRYVSSDIALFRLKDGRLVRTETVAWAWCDEGWCNQQDAWVWDVNKDGKPDIVQHYTLKDDKGKIREERMAVLLQNETGSFEENKELQPDKSKFVMANL